MKYTNFLVAFLLLLSFIQFIPFINPVQAVTVETTVVFQVQNENYTVNHTMPFSQILVSDTWICFNTTSFNITTTNPVNLTLLCVADNIASASDGDTVLSFNASATSGTVTFNIYGFVATEKYNLYKDDVFVSELTANASGAISFSNAVWSTKNFDIIKSGDTPASSNPSETGSSGSSEDDSEPADNPRETTGFLEQHWIHIIILAFVVAVLVILFLKRS